MEGEIKGNISQWETDDISKVEATSETHLEDDKGEGGPVILRVFEFAANPAAFREHKPTKQELFSHHAKGIEAMLWSDGLRVVHEHDPKISVNRRKTKYRIFVAATPARGHLLHASPQTLSDIVAKKPLQSA